jgi:hypothetical protein
MCSAFNTSGRTLGHSGFDPRHGRPHRPDAKSYIYMYIHRRIICEVAKFELLLLLLLLHPLISRVPAPFDFSFLSHLHRFNRDDAAVNLSAISKIY